MNKASTPIKTQEHKEATRINNSLLGPLERPALAWLAKKMPAWVNSDMLTFFGFLATVLIFISYILTNQNKAFLWLASLGFVFNWFGDSLDGTLARYRHTERPRYGFFIDHTVDAMSECLIFIGLGLSPYLDLKIALFALIGYLLLSILVYITTYVQGVFRISYMKFGPTEIRLIAICVNIILFFIKDPYITTPFGVCTVYDIIVLFLAIVFVCVFIIVTLIQAASLSKEDIQQHTEKDSRKNTTKLSAETQSDLP